MSYFIIHSSVLSMNNMQMEVVLKTIATYVLMSCMACIAYPVSPWNITFMHSTNTQIDPTSPHYALNSPLPPPLYNLTLSSSQWPPHNHLDQLVVFHSQDHHACRTHSICALEVRPSAPQTAGIYHREE